MPVYAGPVWLDGEPSEGWIRVERGRVTDEGTGRPSGALDAVILDGVYDYHTHVGDAFLRGRRLPHSLERLVRPPHGLKHRMLAQAKRSQVVSGVRRALEDYAASGTRAILDFREQGIAGLRLVQEATASIGVRGPAVRLLGRPAAGTAEELDQLLEKADGIGLSALRDLEPGTAARVAQACHRAKRPFAIHASESKREPMDTILESRPDLLVHLVKATPRDLKAVHDAGVPAALCPSSNAFFRLRSPVAALHKAGVRFHFGTDNAMLGSRDVVQEAARAHALAPGVPDGFLLRALNTPLEKGIKRLEPVAPGPARQAQRIVVVAQRNGKVRWAQPPIVASR